MMRTLNSLVFDSLFFHFRFKLIFFFDVIKNKSQNHIRHFHLLKSHHSSNFELEIINLDLTLHWKSGAFNKIHTYILLFSLSKRSQWNNEHTILKRSTIHLLCNVCIFYNLHKRNGDYKIGEKLLKQ